MLVDASDIVLTLGNDQKLMLNSLTNMGVLNNDLAWFHQAPISWERAWVRSMLVKAQSVYQAEASTKPSPIYPVAYLGALV